MLPEKTDANEKNPRYDEITSNSVKKLFRKKKSNELPAIVNDNESIENHAITNKDKRKSLPSVRRGRSISQGGLNSDDEIDDEKVNAESNRHISQSENKRKLAAKKSSSHLKIIKSNKSKKIDGDKEQLPEVDKIKRGSRTPSPTNRSPLVPPRKSSGPITRQSSAPQAVENSTKHFGNDKNEKTEEVFTKPAFRRGQSDSSLKLRLNQFTSPKNTPSIEINDSLSTIDEDNSSDSAVSNNKVIDTTFKSIWDQILDFQKSQNSIIFPTYNDKIKLLLGRKIKLTEFRNNFDNKILNNKGEIINLAEGELIIGGLTIEQILTTYPQILKIIAEGQDINKIIAKDDEELEIFQKIYKINEDFKDIKGVLLENLSLKNKVDTNRTRKRIRAVIKLLKHYAPANSIYVLGLVGEIRYKDSVANSVYLASSAISFFLKQYDAYLDENFKRLEVTYEKSEKLLKQLLESKFIIDNGNSYVGSPEIKSIMYIVLQTWKLVLEGTSRDENQKASFKKIHSLKITEFSLNMFIALSKFIIKRQNSDFLNIYDNRIAEEYSLLIIKNLSSNNYSSKIYSFFNASSDNVTYSSVDSSTFLYKLRYLSDLLMRKPNTSSIGENLFTEEDVVNNDILISEYVEPLIYELTEGRAFVMNSAFVNIFHINDGPRDFVRDDNNTYKIDEKLTSIMKVLSDSIGSQAGIKNNKSELKILLIAKSLFLTLVSYLINTFMTRQWVSESIRLLVNFHGIKYLNSYLKSFISVKEKKIHAEHDKYNKIDEQFNKKIKSILELQNLYPFLNDSGEITSINIDENLSVNQRIIAQSFLNAYNKSKLSNNNEIDDKALIIFYLRQINSQDLAAITKIFFNKLCEYTIKSSKSEIKFTSFKMENVVEISEAFGQLIKDNLVLNSNNVYNLNISLEDFSKKVKVSLNDYMVKGNIIEMLEVDKSKPAPLKRQLSEGNRLTMPALVSRPRTPSHSRDEIKQKYDERQERINKSNLDKFKTNTNNSNFDFKEVSTTSLSNSGENDVENKKFMSPNILEMKTEFQKRRDNITYIVNNQPVSDEQVSARN